jgi:hypothetical protein
MLAEPVPQLFGPKGGTHRVEQVVAGAAYHENFIQCGASAYAGAGAFLKGIDMMTLQHGEAEFPEFGHNVEVAKLASTLCPQLRKLYKARIANEASYLRLSPPPFRERRV